jgi:hypothetical protein
LRCRIGFSGWRKIFRDFLKLKAGCLGNQFINPSTAMTFKTVSTIAIAAILAAAFAITSTAFGFAESFAMACIVVMLPLAFEPLGKTGQPKLAHDHGSRADIIPVHHEIRDPGSRFVPIQRHAA